MQILASNKQRDEIAVRDCVLAKIRLWAGHSNDANDDNGDD